jgi:hypothetical protein
MAEELSAACQDASDFIAGLAEGFDAEGVVEGNVPSPLDFAAFFSDIANYDYQILGHQISKLFSALDRVDWPQVGFTLTDEAISEGDLSELQRARTVFEVVAKAGDLVADGVPAPTVAIEEPPCQVLPGP